VRAAASVMADLASSGLTAEQLALVMELSAAVATEARPAVDKAAENKREYDRQYHAERRKNRTTSYDNNDKYDPSPNDINLTPTREEKPKPKGLVKKRQTIPDDWQPQEFAIGSESRKVVDSWPPGEKPAQVEQFIAHHRSKRNTFVDPQDAWSTWVLNTRKWGIGKQHDRPKQASLSSVVHRILSDGRPDDRASQDAGLGSANVDERGAARALAPRRS
jgi:hypothetical protein